MNAFDEVSLYGYDAFRLLISFLTIQDSMDAPLEYSYKDLQSNLEDLVCFLLIAFDKIPLASDFHYFN
jgi:hypothetical protein